MTAEQIRDFKSFNTQPPEGGWVFGLPMMSAMDVSTHSRPKAAGHDLVTHWAITAVSTHSRPKAAGLICRLFRSIKTCFNTQPPEGGWWNARRCKTAHNRFNTQPPEGGWDINQPELDGREVFQHTAARRRLG